MEFSKNINGLTGCRLYRRLQSSLVEQQAKGESGEIRNKAVKVQWRYYEGIFQRMD